MGDQHPGPWWLNHWANFQRGELIFEESPRLSVGAMLLTAHTSEYVQSLDDVQRELDRFDAAIDRFALISTSPPRSLARLIDICTHGSGKGFGFSGDQQNYHDPRNSSMPDILRRRTGLPIGLVVMWLHVAQRLGIPAFGVGMPGHFLLGVQTGGPDDVTYVDCFHGGQPLDTAEAESLYDRLFGGRPHPPFSAEYLQPVSNELMFIRMVANLKHHAAKRRDLTSLADLARLRWFLPMASLDEGRELVRLCVALGAAGEAHYWLQQVVAQFGSVYPETQRALDTKIVNAAQN
jgi:regulator of sirC expression with transglutaminase-like and TPR domain